MKKFIKYIHMLLCKHDFEPTNHPYKCDEWFQRLYKCKKCGYTYYGDLE